MRKLKRRLILLVFCLCVLFGSKSQGIEEVNAEMLTSGDYEYQVEEDGNVTLIKYSGKSTNVTIPSSIEKKTVTYIGSHCFEWCYSLQKVIIPQSVIGIGNGAFWGCSDLRSIIIPESVTVIEGYAFYGTPWLEEQKAEKSLVVINSNLIDASTCTGNVVIPEGVKRITGNSFYMCEGLNKVTLPESVTTIEAYAFNKCNDLSSIIIPGSMIGISFPAFVDCNNLVLSIVKGSHVENYAKQFGISYVYISSNNPNLATRNTVLNVLAEKCQVKVTSVSEKTPTVSYAKSTNGKAKTITIPDTVKVDGITYKVTSVAANALSGNKKVTKVTVGKNVTSIGKNAFKKCTKLKTVALKSTSLKSIGSNAFYGDKNLKTITIKSTKLTSKSVGKNVFKETNKKLTIKVPKKKVSSYKKFLKKKGNKKITVKKG